MAPLRPVFDDAIRILMRRNARSVLGMRETPAVEV
jgi:hypothetical protein